MKKLLFILIAFFVFDTSAQDLSGTWSGILIQNGKELTSANVIYMDLDVVNDKLTGLSRVEVLDELDYAVKSIEGEVGKEFVTIADKYSKGSSNSRNAPTCKLIFELTYDDSMAYLSGKYQSSDCRRVIGEVVLFRSDHEVSSTKDPVATHLWQHRFVENYKKGYPAPEVLKEEQKNFKFQPIYFDHDKSEIRPEYFDYLNRMARVLDGIHDLRVEITGHTDAVGTDFYNIGLSERRAKSIRKYFKSKGIDPEKLEIDFKGKRQPIDTNKTSEGKQRNRRVIFKFI